jgi:hypothetical protein
MRVVRNKPRSPKAPKNIFLGESPAEGGLECEKELGLGDARNPGLDEERDFGTIHCLQDAVTADIERLVRCEEWGGRQSVMMLFSLQ